MGSENQKDETTARERAIESVRENRSRLQAAVRAEYERNIVDMSGPFSLLRYVERHSQELVEQFLAALGGTLNTETRRKETRRWVERGLGPEGAFAAVDALCDAGMRVAEADALDASIANYRREFNVTYEW